MFDELITKLTFYCIAGIDSGIFRFYSKIQKEFSNFEVRKVKTTS